MAGHFCYFCFDCKTGTDKILFPEILQFCQYAQVICAPPETLLQAVNIALDLTVDMLLNQIEPSDVNQHRAMLGALTTQSSYGA
ncbi:hypothetical protein D3C76_976420 [compost metagenome]